MANLRDFIAVTGLVISNWIQMVDFSAHVTVKFDGWPKKTIGHFFYTTSSLCIISNPLVNWNWSYSPETPNSGRNSRYFILCDLEIWWITFENNKGTFTIPHQALCIISEPLVKQTWVTVWKHSIWVKIGNFLSHVTLKFDRWPWKTPVGFIYVCLIFKWVAWT